MLGLGLGSRPEKTESRLSLPRLCRRDLGPQRQGPSEIPATNLALWPGAEPEQGDREASVTAVGEQAHGDGVILFTSEGVQQTSQGQAREGIGWPLGSPHSLHLHRTKGMRQVTTHSRGQSDHPSLAGKKSM